ncbi:MAG: hypothetical protein AAB493_01125 [Patescibacteria group bacterium]
MDSESRNLLEKTLSLTEENNKMLHKIRGVQKREIVWRTLKIIIIAGIAFGAFYFLEPYVNKIVNLYNSISGAEQKLNNSSNSIQSIQDLLKKF